MDIENPMVLPFHEKEPQVVANCENCESPIHEDDCLYRVDGWNFCGPNCLFIYYGVEELEGWEIK